MKFTRTTKKDGTYSNNTLKFICKHYNEYVLTPQAKSIFDVYKNPSAEKIRIYNKYLEMYIDGIISKPCVTTYNSHRFTLSFLLFDEDLRITDFIVVTQDNTYMVEADTISKYWRETL